MEGHGGTWKGHGRIRSETDGRTDGNRDTGQGKTKGMCRDMGDIWGHGQWYGKRHRHGGHLGTGSSQGTWRGHSSDREESGNRQTDMVGEGQDTGGMGTDGGTGTDRAQWSDSAPQGSSLPRVGGTPEPPQEQPPPGPGLKMGLETPPRGDIRGGGIPWWGGAEPPDTGEREWGGLDRQMDMGQGEQWQSCSSSFGGDLGDPCMRGGSPAGGVLGLVNMGHSPPRGGEGAGGSPKPGRTRGELRGEPGGVPSRL